MEYDMFTFYALMSFLFVCHVSFTLCQSYLFYKQFCDRRKYIRREASKVCLFMSLINVGLINLLYNLDRILNAQDIFHIYRVIMIAIHVLFIVLTLCNYLSNRFK